MDTSLEYYPLLRWVRSIRIDWLLDTGTAIPSNQHALSACIDFRDNVQNRIRWTNSVREKWAFSCSNHSGSIRTVTGLNSALVGYTAKVFEILVCCDIIDLIYGRGGPDACYIAGTRIDPDMISFKLTLSALMFSTFTCIEYNPDVPIILDHVSEAIRIHDSYVELAWRYMTCKYDHERAVRSFSNLTLSLLALHRAMTHVAHVSEYNSMVDDLVRGIARMVIGRK